MIDKNDVLLTANKCEQYCQQCCRANVVTALLHDYNVVTAICCVRFCVLFVYAAYFCFQVATIPHMTSSIMLLSTQQFFLSVLTLLQMFSH